MCWRWLSWLCRRTGHEAVASTCWRCPSGARSRRGRRRRLGDQPLTRSGRRRLGVGPTVTLSNSPAYRCVLTDGTGELDVLSSSDAPRLPAWRSDSCAPWKARRGLTARGLWSGIPCIGWNLGAPRSGSQRPTTGRCRFDGAHVFLERGRNRERGRADPTRRHGRHRHPGQRGFCRSLPDLPGCGCRGRKDRRHA